MKNFYNSIKNPLDEPDTINKLLTNYIDTEYHFYNELIKPLHPPKSYKLNQEQKEAFEVTTFNIWKKNILKGKTNNKEFIRFQNYLNALPNPKTKEDLIQIENHMASDRSLNNIYSNFRWDSVANRQSSWQHVFSNRINPFGERVYTSDIEHRLYINAHNDDYYKLCSLFIETCENKNIPYYFKFTERNNREDNLVIYSNTKNLESYLNVLNEIKEKHPDIIKRMGTPPALTGKIDNWIGYGSEPIHLDHSASFNSFRADLLEESITLGTMKYIYEKRNSRVMYQGKVITFMDYISKIASRQLLLSLNKTLKESNYNDIGNRLTYGIDIQTINNPNFKNYLEKQSGFHIQTQLKDIVINKKKKKLPVFEIPLHENKKVDYYYGQFMLIIKNTVSTMKNNDNFKNIIIDEIKHSASINGIDPEKYCFDQIQANYFKSLSNEKRL